MDVPPGGGRGTLCIKARQRATDDRGQRFMQAKVWKTATGGLFVKPPPGSWSAHDAELAIVAIDMLVDPLESYIFVADLSVMTGYEPAARRMWQEWFARRREQLLELWIVGPTIHPVIRLGLAAIAVFTRRSFRFAARVEDIAILAERR